MKILLAMIVTGLCAAGIGAGILYLDGGLFPTWDMMVMAAKLSVSTPTLLIEWTLSSDNKLYYAGFSAIFYGGTFAAAMLMVTMVFALLSPVVSRLRHVARKRAEAARQKPAEDVRDTVAPGKGDVKKTSRTEGIIGRLLALRRKKVAESFVDDYADLEGEAQPKAPGRVGAFFRAALDRFKKKPQPIVIHGPGQEKIVIAPEHGPNFCEDLKSWYGDMRGAAKDDPSIIERARKLAARSSEAMREKLVEQDSLNGEFMLLMLDAWAEKQVGGSGKVREEEPVEQLVDPDLSAFSKAIEDVRMRGVESAEGDEKELDLEADDVSADFLIDDLDDEGDVDPFVIEDEAEEADPSEGFVLDDEDIEEDDTTDVGVTSEDFDDTSDVDVFAVAARIMELEALASAVSNFEAEWEEDMAEADLRKQYAEELFTSLAQSLETRAADIAEMSELDREDDHGELNWLQQNMNDLDMRKASLIESIAPIDVAGGFEDGAEEDDDLDSSFSISGVTQDREEIASAEDEPDESDDEVQDAFGSIDGKDEDIVQAEPATEGVVELTADENEGDPAEAGESPVIIDEEPVADEPVEAEDHEPDSAEETPEEVSLVPEGKDMTIGELEEVASSGDLIYNWGYVSRGAGASEAKISHSVLAKDGLRRRVVGIVHLVAGWRLPDRDESRRLNIILRYVPEGEWELEMDHGVKMVDSRGNFVQVSPEMLKQPEIEGSTLIVHFYGPGAPEGMLVEEGNVMVTTSTLSMDVLKRKMTS